VPHFVVTTLDGRSVSYAAIWQQKVGGARREARGGREAGGAYVLLLKSFPELPATAIDRQPH